MTKILVTNIDMINQLSKDNAAFTYQRIKPGFYSFDIAFGEGMDLDGTIANPGTLDSITDTNSIKIYCIEI